MRKKSIYDAPATELIVTRLERNCCLSGNVPSNSIEDFNLVDESDIEWD